MAEGFTCAVPDEKFRSACEDLPKYSGSRYCVLHEPSEGKNKGDFEEVKKSKLDRKDYDFGGTIFPDGTSDFSGFEFRARTNFSGTTFIGDAQFAEAQFGGEWTSFSGVKFDGGRTDFSGARFGGEWTDFIATTFGGDGTNFLEAEFSGGRTDFTAATFGEDTSFSKARFDSVETSFAGATFAKEVDFSQATFKEKVAFLGSTTNTVFDRDAWASFNRSRIEKPELVTFNTVLLHPGWFINVDVRKVDFTDVKWYGMPGGPKGTFNKEIDNLKKRDIESPHSLLAQACRRLSANAEENHEYPLANEFHYWSRNALRKQGWTRLGLIGTLYWALSGYGVRAARAFGWLVVIWVGFALLYMLMGSKELHVFSASEAWKYVAQHIWTNPLGWRAPSQSEIKHFWADIRPALVYSLGALARLRPEPQPDGPSWFQFFVTVEGILGPLQVALLALAIRRKVMR